MTKNEMKAHKLAAKIVVQVQRGAGKGIVAASRFLAARLKEVVSEPAPRKAVRAAPLPGKKLGGILYYRASKPAIPGAPPRKLSGRLRTSIVAVTMTPTRALVGASARGMPSRKHPRGFPYPRWLETGTSGGKGKLGAGPHPFILPTISRYRRELRAIVGRPVVVGMRHR